MKRWKVKNITVNHDLLYTLYKQKIYIRDLATLVHGPSRSLNKNNEIMTKWNNIIFRNNIILIIQNII